MNDQVKKALEVRFDSDAGDDLSVREYFYALLRQLWCEKEGFSGKRPFGNSGWEFELYAPLIRDGFIKGTLDEDGHVAIIRDERAAYNFVHELIEAVFAVGAQ